MLDGSTRPRPVRPTVRADGLGAVVVLVVVVLVASRLSPSLLEAASIAVNAAVGLACLRLHRPAWTALGAFLLLWSLADVVWILDDVGTVPAPPGLADAVYVLGVPLAVLGLLWLPGGRWERGAAPRVLLDVLVIAVPVLAVGDVLLVPEVRGSDVDVEAAFLLAWPVVDVLLTCLALVLSRRRGDRVRPDLALLVLAFATWTLGDTWLAWGALGGREYLGSAAQVPFVVAPLLVGLAGLGTWRRSHRAGESGAWGAGEDGVARNATGRAVLVLPDVVVIAAGLVCIAARPERWHEWALICAGAALAALRYAVVTSDAQTLRATLERRVEERTERLQVASNRLVRVVESVGEAVVGLDPETRIVFVNRVALDLLRATEDQLLGRVACDALCSERHPECPILLAVGFGQRMDRTETAFWRADGSLVPVEVAASPVPPGADDDLVSVLSFHDVSERHAVEQTKNRFVTSVSHELRTPLAAIRGALEMLGDGDAGDLGPAAAHLVHTAERGATRLSRLVDDLLDVERIASGSFSVSPGAVVVGQVVGDVVALLGDWAAGEGVLLRTGRLDGTVLADARRVEQALLNLVANAVKFSEPGGVVELSATPEGSEVVLVVRDRGRGIPADDLPRVFDRFHQVASGDATQHGGTGLGLAITRSIVERHGGRIWVESTPGVGSTFSFTLPLLLTDDPVAHPQDQSVAG